MLKRHREGAAMSDPVLVEAGIEMLAEACPDQPARTWDLLRTARDEGFQSIDRRACIKSEVDFGPQIRAA
jgi:hypothetical protein